VKRPQTRTIRRLLGGIATAAVLGSSIVGCSAMTTSGPSSSSSSSTAASSTSIDGTSSGNYTATFDGTSVTIMAAYLIEGTSVTIDSGTYQSLTSDQVVFLVVNGGTLNITGATISKSGDASASSQQNTGDVSDDYNFYGLNSAIVVLGDGSSVAVADLTIDTTSGRIRLHWPPTPARAPSR
jgi:hypothetical protein